MSQLLPPECPKCGNKPLPWNIIHIDPLDFVDDNGETINKVSAIKGVCSLCGYTIFLTGDRS